MTGSGVPASDLAGVLTSFRLEGRVALVTGAGRGLGRAMALALGGAGADLALADVNEADVEAVAAEARNLGRRAEPMTVDVGEGEQVERMVARIVAELGRLDIVVNNAGVTSRSPFEDLAEEVPVLLGAALAESAPIVILHLTRPPIVVPDRAKLGIASHFEAAQGAYLVRDYTPGEPRGGTIVAQGTSAMVSLCQVLPELDARRLNVKIVYAASAEMFARQPAAVREGLLSAADRIDSTFITTQSRGSMGDWTFHEGAAEYALSSDWDNRWRTGGTVEEVIDEAMLSPEAILKGIERFVRERPARLGRQEAALTQALRESEGTPQPA